MFGEEKKAKCIYSFFQFPSKPFSGPFHLTSQLFNQLQLPFTGFWKCETAKSPGNSLTSLNKWACKNGQIFSKPTFNYFFPLVLEDIDKLITSTQSSLDANVCIQVAGEACQSDCDYCYQPNKLKTWDSVKRSRFQVLLRLS